MELDDDKTRTHITLTKDTMVGHYRIVEKIGAGGMGEVYLAQDTKLERSVALKFLSTFLCADDDCRKRFTREAQAAAKLSHPNIITIHEVSEYQGRPFFAMEHVEGRSLKEHASGKDITIDQILELAIQICEGVRAAHDKGIIHRDIKPSNVLIDSHGRARIVDFGLAAVAGANQLTKTGSTMGTVGYMSPEQVTGADVDQRSDLFSLGVLLYELVTQRNPFRRDTEAATLRAVSDETPEPLARFKSDVPDGLQTIIEKSLEKNVETRYQTAAGIISDLKRLKREIAQATPTTAGLPSIAVLPFANLSADPEQEYFCDGMAEEIINALTHVEGLRVVARTSCFAFKGKTVDIREVGRQLNVSAVLEGSVRKAGNRLRITAQLVNVADGYHLWSERYDRDSEDIFAIQDEISLAIVNNLKVKLLKEDEAALTKRHTADPEAHKLYLKGRYFWSRRTRESFEKAIEYFKIATEIDPNYAQAYAGMAASYNDLPNYSSIPPAEAYPLAKEAAMKALELDPDLAEGHTALGLILRDYEWDWEGAEKAFKRAIELNPAYETAHQWYAHLLGYLGRADEAVAEMSKSYELDPLSLAVNRNFGFLYYLLHRFDDALTMLHRAAELDPTFSYTYFIMGMAYLRKEQFDKAIETLQKERALTGGANPVVVVPLGTAYARMGDRKKADEVLAGVEEIMKHEYISPFYLGQLYFALGKLDEGFELFEKAYNERDIYLRFLKAHPIEDEVRADPRYKALLKKMNLA
ncbi:MAG: protein kinase [Candidatus Zixiibacteriota bacterium]|nr:MAG: protein kinase [candidate division Zixibacteria bacterium]